MNKLNVKHMYDVVIHWLNHGIEIRSVIAINSFQAISKVVDGSGKGMYDAEKSKARLVRYNVAVQRGGNE